MIGESLQVIGIVPFLFLTRYNLGFTEIEQLAVDLF